MYTEWENKKDQFKVIDLRQAKGNFSQGLFRQADQVPEGSGLQIIQSFEPHPLYEAMKDRGFEYHVEEVKPYEFHIWFYRSEAKPASGKKPFGPAALLNFPIIDKNLGRIAVEFWDETWNDERHYLSYEMRLILSLANAVGAGRYRQAARGTGQSLYPRHRFPCLRRRLRTHRLEPGHRLLQLPNRPVAALRCLQTDQTGRSQRHEP